MGLGNIRLDWLDKLRTITIFMVVLYHVGGVYEGAGMWASFWIVDDPNTLTWVGIMGIVFDIMVMPIMFFIAGYLVPHSLKSGTTRDFIVKKFKRLMIPWLIAVVTLIPIYKWFFLYSRGLPQESWTTYFHFTGKNTQNWLWFLPVLFLFNMAYSTLVSIKPKLPKFSQFSIIFTVFIVSLVFSISIAMLVGHRTWTHSAMLDFENERLLLYFLVFLVGAWYSGEGLLSNKPERSLLYNSVSAVAWIPITFHIFMRLIPFIYPDGFEFTLGYISLWWLSFNVSLLTLMYSMAGMFQRYFQGTGRIWRALNRNSYGVYIVHVIAIGVFGTLLLQIDASGWIKYPVLVILAYGFSNFVVSVYYKIKMILQN